MWPLNILFSRIILLSMLVILSGCDNDEPPALSATGQQMYLDYCAGCHKASGVGKIFMGVPPAFAHELSRAEVVKLIREGDPRYPRMPTFPQLSFSQGHKIVSYLRELKEKQRYK